MATAQDAITQVITQAAVEATKEAVQEVMDARAETNTRHRSEMACMRPKIGRPLLKWLRFDWGSMDKHEKQWNFKKEVKNIFQGYKKSQTEEVLIIKSRIDRLALTQAEQEACNAGESFWDTQ